LATLTFNKLAKQITVDAPDTSITCQELAELIRDYEEDFENHDIIPHIINTSGKVPVPGGTTGIVIELLDNWELAFEARAGPSLTEVEVTGGVLTTTGGQSPFFETAFTSPTRSIDVTPALPDVSTILADLTTIKADTSLARKILQNDYLIDEVANTFTVFDDDGTTPLVVWDLKDENGSPAVTAIHERRKQ